MWASMQGHCEVAEVLIRAGADVHACDTEVSLNGGRAAQAVIVSNMALALEAQ